MMLLCWNVSDNAPVGRRCLRVLAIGSSSANSPGELLFTVGEDADAGFVVQRGAFRITRKTAAATRSSSPGTLIASLHWWWRWSGLRRRWL